MYAKHDNVVSHVSLLVVKVLWHVSFFFPGSIFAKTEVIDFSISGCGERAGHHISESPWVFWAYFLKKHNITLMAQSTFRLLHYFWTI